MQKAAPPKPWERARAGAATTGGAATDSPVVPPVTAAEDISAPTSTGGVFAGSADPVATSSYTSSSSASPYSPAATNATYNQSSSMYGGYGSSMYGGGYGGSMYGSGMYGRSMYGGYGGYGSSYGGYGGYGSSYGGYGGGGYGRQGQAEFFLPAQPGQELGPPPTQRFTQIFDMNSNFLDRLCGYSEQIYGVLRRLLYRLAQVYKSFREGKISTAAATRAAAMLVVVSALLVWSTQGRGRRSRRPAL